MNMELPTDFSGSEQASSVWFEADVHLIQVLGEQLIGSEKVGILELVKNAYDAGATRCDVWIEKVPGLPDAEPSDEEVDRLPGPVITIYDNGSGMDETTIRKGWLRPATRIKTSAKERLKRERAEARRRGSLADYERLVAALKLEYGGRLPLGEKGVGRFATHRLGRHLILQTKNKSQTVEYVLEIDWKDFDTENDDPVDLNSIPLTLRSRTPRLDYGATESGTRLRIYGGRPGFEWTEGTLHEIGQAIALLRSPRRQEAISFDVAFHCPQLSDQSFDVPTETVPAPLTCTAIVDENGKAEIEIRFDPPSSLSVPLAPIVWPESIDLRIYEPEETRNYWHASNKSLRVPACGPFILDLKFWFRTKDWIEAPNWREFTDYLDEFGGIGVFRDGLSILPAQVTSRDDWLRLSKRHIKKGSNISYYQLSGSLDLVQELNIDLVDRTSREGMLETRAFDDLRELVRPIIFALEFRVKAVREQYDKLKRGERPNAETIESRVRQAGELIRTLAAHYDFVRDPYELGQTMDALDGPEEAMTEVAGTLEELRTDIVDLREQLDALLEAAGFGIAISVAVHEIEKLTSNLYFGLNRLSKRGISLPVDMHLEVDRLGDSAQALLNELKRLAPLRVTRLERPRIFKVRDTVLAAAGAFRLSWEDFDIHFVPPHKDEDFAITGSYGACSQVFANLFDNATYWLKSLESGTRRIVVQMNRQTRTVVVADSGPGIAEKMKPHLFELFYSLKTPPSGLGLYICRYYMRQMKGTIRESLDKERLPGIPGAHFTLLFPREGDENGGAQ